MITSNKQRLTLFIDPNLIKHARAHAVVEDISLAQLVTNALTDYLPEEIVIRKKDVT